MTNLGKSAAVLVLLVSGSLSTILADQQQKSATPLPTQRPPAEKADTAAADDAQQSAKPSAVKEPAPAYASDKERKLRNRLTAQLEPLAGFKIDAAQASLLRDALRRLRVRKVAEAREIEEKITDPVARKLALWKRLVRGGGVEADAYRVFLAENPLWPDREILQRLYERALLREGGSAKTIRRYFKENAAVSGAGDGALASAELALGNRERARELAAKAWCHGRLPAYLEAEFFARFETLLTERDHKCRLDRLLVSSPRARLIRRSRAEAAERLLARLSPPEAEKAAARIKVFQRSRRALRALAAVVKKKDLIKGDWGLAYQRINRARRAKDYKHAYALLKAVPGADPALVNPDAWWDERERHARYWLSKKKIRRAYAIIEGARPESANPAKEQAFLAGWMALMQLKKPAAARGHFARMVRHADGPLSKSMSEYWLARSFQALGKATEARTHFKASAAVRDTFHALLSHRVVRPNSRRIDLPPAQLPTAQELQRFLAADAVKGLLLAAGQAKLSRRDVLAFYRSLGIGLESEGELALLAQLASNIGDGQGEVRVGKYAIARGYNLFEFAYPVHHLPTYEPLRKPVETALVLAIGRQESEFNTQIVSRAGARGVLQVMPITVRHVCRQYKISCSVKNLLADPAYNARVASAYIADRHDDFGGSYILTLTGFNAGPGRTRQWLREMGDPRAKRVDPLDWVYRIPFRETRLYVRKVLSNVQIYRARLGLADPLRIDRDLRRGRP